MKIMLWLGAITTRRIVLKGHSLGRWSLGRCYRRRKKSRQRKKRREIYFNLNTHTHAHTYAHTHRFGVMSVAT